MPKRSNDKFNRVDVKLPIELYTQISEIAVNSFDAKIHHISGKPEITPTLIYLLELGVQSFTSGNELIKKSNTDNYTDTIPITENRVRELIENELIPVQSKLDELSEVIYRLTYTDTNTDNLSIAVTERILDNLTDNDTDSFTDKLEVNTDNLTDNDTDKLEVDTDTNTDNDTDNIALSELPNLPSSEVLPQIVPIAENKAINVEIVENVDKLTKERVMELLKKHKIPTVKDTPLVINNNELLYPFLSELLGKKVDSSSISKVANKDKHYLAPAIVWEYFLVDKVKGKWQWTRLK